MGKKPVLFIFAFLLLILSFVQFGLDRRSANLQSYEIVMLKRERTIRFVGAIAATLSSTGRLDLVEGHLNDARRIGWLDFHMLTFEGEVMSYESVRPLSDEAYDTLIGLHPPDAFWEFQSKFESTRSIRGPASKSVEAVEDFRFYEMDLGGGRRLKLGFNLNREAFLTEMAAYRSEEDRRIFVLSMLITLAVFLFSARDLLRVAKVVRTKGIRGLKEIRIFSKEAEALQHGLEGFGEAVERLEAKNKTLEAQILPSLRTELQSGKAPPYDFNCTMVRTDINNFTKIFHAHPVDEFLTTINEFFTGCSHVISRYEGFIHEFVGDEIIYYFKDEQHSNSFTAALACAREIERIAENIHLRTSSQPGYAFRVKSSVSHGKIRFGPLLNGFSLAGAPLIETTRILSAVNEKGENTIHFDSTNVVRLHEAIEFEEAFRTHLKGMDGERTLMRFKGHCSIEDFLARVGTTNFEKLPALWDYRSDADLSKLLDCVERMPGSAIANEALHLFSRVQVTRCEPAFVDRLVATLRNLMANSLDGKPLDGKATGGSFARALATLAGALPRLVPMEKFESIADLVTDLVEYPDPRVVANTIETLQAIRDTGRVPKSLGRRLINSKNTRVAANALVFMGTTEISKDVIRRVRKLMDSQDPTQVAAGFFAWGEVASHHLRHDPVYYRTQAEFIALLNIFESVVARVPTAASHASEAALKAGEYALSKALATRTCA